MVRHTTINRPAVILSAVLLAALVAAVAGALVRFNPGWWPVPLVAVCFVVALEAGFIHRVARADRMELFERLRYMAPELLVLAASMRAVATLALPHPSLTTVLVGWLYDPLSAFDARFAAHMLAGLLVGWAAHATLGDFALLAPAAADGRPDAEGQDRYYALISGERQAALARIGARFAAGGIVLLAALSLESADLRSLGGAPRPISSLSVAAALAYLVSGFLLHSRARLAMLQSRWAIEGAQVAPAVASRWSRGSALLVVAVLLAAAALPRDYGMGLLDGLRTMLSYVGYGLAVAGYIITWLFGTLLVLPAWLLSLLLPPSPGGPVSMPPMDLPAPPPEAASEPRLGPAVIFWICVLLLLGYAARVTLQRHPRLRRTLRALWLHLLRAAADLLRGGRRWAALAAAAVRARPAAPAPAPTARRARPAGRDPRSIVAHYYRAIVAEADRAGFPRRAGETPEEYRRELAGRLPPADPDMAELTDLFVRARYAPGPVTPAEVRRARVPWQRLRRLLRARGAR